MCAPENEQQEEAERLDGKLKRGRRDAVCREWARGPELWLGWLQQADLHARQCHLNYNKPLAQQMLSEVS